MSLADLRTPSAERLLSDALSRGELAPQRVLATSLGRGQLAAAAARQFPQAAVSCWFLDLYPARETRTLLAEEGRGVEVVCAADLPTGECDCALVPVTRGGEAELARDVLQQAFDRLRLEGVLMTAVDNPRDVWLQHELEKLQKGVTRLSTRWGVVYRLIKRQPLKRRRDFTARFAFRDQGRLVQVVSRPGVFSHRQLDLGARALLEAGTIAEGMRVVDIGCGSGAVGLAAALRGKTVHVLAIDSNARAVACTAVGAELNNVSARLSVCHDSEGRIDEPGSFDLVLGNPPYYSHYAIAELFLQAARRALRPAGTVLMVTKQSEWYVARMQQLFADVEAQTVRGYTVIRARQR
jgi:16S rRNA G1207 methylase RsmC